MKREPQPDPGLTTRRKFLVTSAKSVTATAIASSLVGRGDPSENNTIRVALIGCGGRGTGAAANALSTKGPTLLWAMADVFEERLRSSLETLAQRFPNQVKVPPERRFTGLDGFQKAMEAMEKGDVVILATPPAFRPIHLERAVARGLHVFMEKSFAVDAPGVRRVLKAGQAAKQKNLKIAGGLMWRHDVARQEVIKRIHDGAIGDLILLRTYRMHGPVGFKPKTPGMTELAHQIANYSNFTWLNGSFFVDWLIHNIDVCCWAKNAWPVSAQGQGGRQTRTEPDQMYDHYAVEYAFPDGTRLFAQGRHIARCYDIFSDFAHGTRGSAIIMESLAAARPRIYRNHLQTPETETWRYTGPEPDPYQVEIDLLFEAIRSDKPYNETERCAQAVLVAIMGRMAAESGQLVTYEQAMASDLELAPGLESFTLDSPPPVQPNEKGQYPVAMPGITRAF
ncbi:MAG: Gfo/Idh/MocA family oxidoreductase [Verrucomicrobiae bacterium]|nr:Gfo/Idh/MocA family oxidoreductase [Verrucomicrobiae bacterium]